LDNYQTAVNALQKSITEAEEEAEELRKLCFSRGLVDEAGRPTEFETQEQQSFVGDVDAGAETSEYVKFPLLLPQPGIQRQMKFDAGPIPEESSYSPGDHINQWLLHQLRSSPLDVNLLARTFEKEFGHIENKNWQSNVLNFWYKDGASEGASDYQVYSSGKLTRAARRSGHSTKSQSDTTGEHSLGVLITSSLSGSDDVARPGLVESRQSYRLLVPDTLGAYLSSSH